MKNRNEIEKELEQAIKHNNRKLKNGTPVTMAEFNKVSELKAQLLAAVLYSLKANH